MITPEKIAPVRSQQNGARIDHMISSTRAFANRMVERLRALHEKYPSQELADAIRNLEEWQAALPRMEP